MENVLVLDRELRGLAEDYRAKEVEILRGLRELDECSGYLFFGCGSLSEYARERLGLEGSRVWAMISVARVSKEVPELVAAIAEGELDLSHGDALAPVLNNPEVSLEEKKAWVEDSKGSSVKDIKDKILEKKPEVSAEEELVKRISKNVRVIQIRVTDEEFEAIELSRQLARSPKYKKAILSAVLRDNERRDPLVKAKKAEEKENRKKSSANLTNVNGQAETLDGEPKTESEPPVAPYKIIQDRKTSSAKPANTLTSNPDEVGTKTPVNRSARQYIPVKVKYPVILKYQGGCGAIDPETGEPCNSRDGIDVHHKVPVSQGGTDDPSNLMLLCYKHHKLEHFFS